MSTEKAQLDTAKTIDTNRGAVYGDFREMAHVAQGLKSLMDSGAGTFNDVQKEAADLVCTKLARIACGDPGDLDSWVDIAGYANLVVADIRGGGK